MRRRAAKLTDAETMEFFSAVTDSSCLAGSQERNTCRVQHILYAAARRNIEPVKPALPSPA